VESGKNDETMAALAALAAVEARTLKPCLRLHKPWQIATEALGNPMPTSVLRGSGQSANRQQYHDHRPGVLKGQLTQRHGGWA